MPRIYRVMSGRFVDNPYYVEYESLLTKLHRLIARGKGDTQEADAVRDEMDRPERELDSEEMARLNGLSADLYMLQDNEIFEPVDPQEWTPQRLSAELTAACERGDWEAVLALLRKGPAFLSQDQIACLRARAYESLGHHDTARLFAEYAARLNPQVTMDETELRKQIAAGH